MAVLLALAGQHSGQGQGGPHGKQMNKFGFNARTEEIPCP